MWSQHLHHSCCSPRTCLRNTSRLQHQEDLRGLLQVAELCSWQMASHAGRTSCHQADSPTPRWHRTWQGQPAQLPTGIPAHKSRQNEEPKKKNGVRGESTACQHLPWSVGTLVPSSLFFNNRDVAQNRNYARQELHQWATLPVLFSSSLNQQAHRHGPALHKEHSSLCLSEYLHYLLVIYL